MPHLNRSVAHFSLDDITRILFDFVSAITEDHYCFFAEDIALVHCMCALSAKHILLKEYP